MSVFKKWWVRATPDYHYQDFAIALPVIIEKVTQSRRNDTLEADNRRGLSKGIDIV
jgi:hypothetical protein